MATAGTAASAFVTGRGRARGARLATVSLSASLLLAMGVTSTAGAATMAQKTLKIANTSLTATVGTSVKVTTSGGSGTGALKFVVAGAHCTISTSGSLSASAAASCKVTATKAASKGYAAATSASKTFVFAAAAPSVKITNTTLSAKVGVTITVTASGGSGSGGYNFATTGAVCSINPVTGVLNALAVGTCPVTATKGSVTSLPVTFTFTKGDQPTLVIGNDTSTDSLVGTATNVFTTGGAGTGAVSFTVTGTGCTIDASGALNDSAAGTCVVSATKAADASFAAASAAPVTFTFVVPGPNTKVENPTFTNPDKAVLTSVTGTDGSQIDDTVNGDAYFINQYFSPSDHWYMNYFNPGATVTLTWTVTGSYGQPLANTAVALQGNLGYSSAKGITWSESTLNSYPGTGSATPQGYLQGKTDANGVVTFTLHNTNTVLQAGTRPADTTTTGGAEKNENSNLYTDMLLAVGTDTYTSGTPNPKVVLATDRVDFILIPASGAPAAPLSVTNASLAATAGTPVTVTQAGGTGSGAVTFSVTGTGCTINATTGVLNASAAGSCAVTVTKAGSPTQTATATFVFAAAPVGENPTVAHPDVARLTSVTGTVGPQIDDTVNGQTYFINQYFNATDHWYINYIHVSAPVTLTWHVIGSDGIALANANVSLQGNLGYSSAKGVTWDQSSLNAYPGTGSGTPQGFLNGKTDASGNVTFTLKNLNTTQQAGSTPSDLTTTGGAEKNEASNPYTDMLLQVGSDVYTGDPAKTINEAVDRVDFILIP